MQSEDKFVTNYQSIDQRNKQTKSKPDFRDGGKTAKRSGPELVKRFGIGIEIAMQPNQKQKQFKYNGTTTTRSRGGSVNNSARAGAVAAESVTEAAATN